MFKLLGKITLICSFLLCFSATTFAEDWVEVTASDTTIHSYDRDSIKQLSKGRYTVFTKQEFNEEEGKRLSKKLNFPRPVAYYLLEMEYNINKKSFRGLSRICYDHEGKIVYQSNNVTKYQPVQANSFGEITFNIISKEYHRQFPEKI